MHNRPARWTMAFAAAALVALPLTASAQTQPPPSQPPTTTQPPASAQPPATTQPPATAQPPQQGDTKIDAAAAKQHITEARDTLSQLTSMPEAAKLQGDARTQVSQLISNFNALISTQGDWHAAYAKVDSNLTTLLGAEGADPAPAASAVAGAVGTSGTTPAALDPAIRAKLVEFRTHLKEFEHAAGGSAAGATAPPAATGSTASPANPTSTVQPGDAAAAGLGDRHVGHEPAGRDHGTRGSGEGRGPGQPR